jgi:MtaA/CmuA family methyltransferase
MTGRERVLAMYDGRLVDRLPLMPITMMFAADQVGVSYRQYVTDHQALVRAQLRTAERFGFDYVSAISDPAREAVDLGAVVEFFDDQPPAIVDSQALLRDKARLARLEIPDFARGRTRDRLDGIELMKGEVGDDLLVEGWIEGPCALAADLRGVDTLMLDFTDDPGFVRDLFEFVVAMEIEFARAQVEAGADLIGVGDAIASLIGPRRYVEYVLPYEQRLIGAIKSMGARVRLHICGNTRKILREMGMTGADQVDLDYLSPMADAREAMGPDQTLCGNIDPVRVLRDQDPDRIFAELEACYEAAGPRYVVGAGCEVPRGTPEANVRAMADFARSRGAS